MLSRLLSDLRRLLGASLIEPADLFSLQAQALRLPAGSPDETIRFFVAGCALGSLARKLDRALENEASATDYRYVLSLIERVLSASNLTDAELAMVELINIVRPRSASAH